MSLLPANDAHWHLVLNHTPVIGSLAALLLLAWAFIKNTDESKRIALTAVVLVALFSIPAFLTGEPAEHLLKGIPGISKRWMSNHESIANTALWVAIGAGVLALGVLLFFRKPRSIPRWAMAVVLIVMLAVGGLMARTANYGGKIHHPEILPESSGEAAQKDVQY